jgi:hypothetical protein
MQKDPMTLDTINIKDALNNRHPARERATKKTDCQTKSQRISLLRLRSDKAFRLSFDRVRSTKRQAVSVMVQRGWSIEMIQAELKSVILSALIATEGENTKEGTKMVSPGNRKRKPWR